MTRGTFVGKIMSLLFNMLTRSVKTFLPRSKRLLISWLQSPSAVILEPRKIYTTKMYILNIYTLMDFPGGSVVKNSPATQETQVQSLGREDPLEKEVETCFSILAWEIL